MRATLGDSVDYRRVEVVGPRVSSELLSYGTLGVMLAIIGILLYLWFRFEWQFALGAMIANIHDIVLTIGFMALFQLDFDLSSIAALLTILGYSLNDTVVIYDRIREMLRRYKRMPTVELINIADQRHAVALDHHPCHRDAGAAVAAAVRWPDHPQLHRGDDVRRRAGRHLHVDLHRVAHSHLPGRWPGPGAGGARGRSGCGIRQTGAGQALTLVHAAETPHLPHRAAIDGYGKGGFSFAGMSHRGSLLCLPSGIWAWPAVQRSELTEAAFERVFAEASDIGLFLIGAGRDAWVLPDPLRLRFHQAKISVEVARTGTAVSTYNILLGEGRRVAAGLIAVD